MKGKEKCKILKEIRAEIARANDIEWVTENCTHKGECRGTCPKCESELRRLERALELRRRLGKTVAVAGLSAGLIASTVSCGTDNNYEGGTTAVTEESNISETTEIPYEMGEIVLQGDIEIPESEESPESFFELMGDIAAYDSELFERFEPIKRTALENIYLIGFIDTEYTDDTDFVIAAGESFEVVGTSDDYGMYMIAYCGQLFGCDRAELDLISEKAE